MLIADTLSRIKSKGNSEFDNWEEKEVEISIEEINEFTTISGQKHVFKMATETDKELRIH